MTTDGFIVELIPLSPIARLDVREVASALFTCKGRGEGFFLMHDNREERVEFVPLPLLVSLDLPALVSKLLERSQCAFAL